MFRDIRIYAPILLAVALMLAPFAAACLDVACGGGHCARLGAAERRSDAETRVAHAEPVASAAHQTPARTSEVEPLRRGPGHIALVEPHLPLRI
ncbi:MAG: hypothetical protein C0418_04665 [Coriobacteriaceae bacterium]|nr:hypothetical protein [Coriobacteriaceae bacterium]